MLDKLSDERKKEYKESFEIYDIKKDGSILLSDYEKVLKLLKLNIDEFQRIFQEYSLKGRDSIRFEDFIKDINSMQNEEELIIEEKEEDIDKLINAFKNFEEDEEGKISIENFKEILKSNGDVIIKDEEIKLIL